MRQEGFSNNSVITTDVRLDDRGRLMVLVNQLLPLDFSGELALLHLLEVLGQVNYLFTLVLLLLVMGAVAMMSRPSLVFKNRTNDT